MWSDVVSAALSGTGLVTLIGAVTVFIRTRQQGKITEANVIERLGSTVGDFAENVRRDAQNTIDLIRRDAQVSVDRAVGRAEDAERRAATAEERSRQAWSEASTARIQAMEAAATVRRLTTAILSPYATIDGLRAMVSPEDPAVNGRG